MDTIRLDTEKQTFNENLIKMGYNYKIVQYENLIDSIRKRIVLEIKESLKSSKLKITIKKIFKKDISLLILEDITLITKINITYLKELIEQGELNLYLKEEYKDYCEDTQKEAYLVKKINRIKLKDYFKKEIQNKYKKELTIKGNGRNIVKKCINSESINISKEEKIKINNEINSYIKKLIIKDSRFKIEDIDTVIGFLNLDKIYNSLEDYLLDNILIDLSIEDDIFPVLQVQASKEASLKYKEIDRHLSIINIISTSTKEETFLNIIELFNNIEMNEIIDLFKENGCLSIIIEEELINSLNWIKDNYYSDLKDYNVRVLFLEKEYLFSYEDVLSYNKEEK